MTFESRGEKVGFYEILFSCFFSLYRREGWTGSMSRKKTHVRDTMRIASHRQHSHKEINLAVETVFYISGGNLTPDLGSVRPPTPALGSSLEKVSSLMGCWQPPHSKVWAQATQNFMCFVLKLCSKLGIEKKYHLTSGGFIYFLESTSIWIYS